MKPIRLLLLFVALVAAPLARADMVYLPTAEGAARLLRAAPTPQTFGLLSHLETEMYLTFCGPASLATTLNSLGIEEPTPAVFFPYHRLTQESLFVAANLAVKSYAAVQGQGLMLAELTRFANNLGVTADAAFAEETPMSDMRERLRAALANPQQRVVANYTRAALGQEGTGHFSPIAAYDPATDAFLVLDVARYKYPPAWVTFDLLYAGMLAVDPDSRRSRGALFLTNARTATR